MMLFRMISLLFILLGILVAITNMIITKHNHNKPKKREDGHNFCILIPARYESGVIEALLTSIEDQSFKINMKDVYVIIESKEDKTYDICNKHRASIFIRKKLELQRKGYALDEAVKYILDSGKHYDAYFIFDADNVLHKDYFKNMLPIFDKGYDLASGYRNCKNGNDSVIAAASTLTFSLVNTVFNNKKNKETKNITFSGTGFYIRGYLVEEWKGYPFHTLTEDYELSSFATLNNLTTFYNTKSVFYDEQPLKFKNTINQRERWIKGYFSVRKLYSKKMFKALNIDDKNNGSKIDELVGIYPYILMVIGIVIWLLADLFFLIYYLLLRSNLWKLNAIELLILFLIIYIVLQIMTLVIIILEGSKLDLNFKSRIKVLFYNPIFMTTYVSCAIKALTSKEIAWKRVEHGEKKD